MSLLADADWVTHSLRVNYLRYVDDHYARQVIEFPFESSHGLELKSADGMGLGASSVREPYGFDGTYSAAGPSNGASVKSAVPPSLAPFPPPGAGGSNTNAVELPRPNATQQQPQSFTQADLLEPRTRARAQSRSRPSVAAPRTSGSITAVEPSLAAPSAATTIAAQSQTKGNETANGGRLNAQIPSKALRTEAEPPPPPPLTFEKLSVQEIRARSLAQRPRVSAIAAVLQAQSESAANPFAALYRDVCGKNATLVATAPPSPAPAVLSSATVRPRHGPGANAMSSRSRGAGGGAGGPGGRAGGPSRVEVYFPFADRLANTSSSGSPYDCASSTYGPVALNAKAGSMKLSVRPDAKMEEVIGYALYCYVDVGWSPSLAEVADWAQGDQDEIKLTTLGYCLRIVEDGEVDDDFPALDRSLVVGRFGGDEFAVCQASAAQVKENEVTSAPLRPSRQAALLDSLKAMAKAKAEASGGLLTVTSGPSSMSSNMTALVSGAGKLSIVTGGPMSSLSVPGGSNAPPGSSATSTSTTIVHGGAGLSSSLMPATGGTRAQLSAMTNSSAALSSSVGGSRSVMSGDQGKEDPKKGSDLGLEASVFLRVLHNPKQNVHVKIMIQVPAQMYFADVLDLICRKVQEGKSAEWALVAHYGDQDVVVPLNRTVESLDEACDLKLVRRDSLAERGAVGRITAPGGNPNTSIFAGRNKSKKQEFANAMDMSAYKSWKVIRAARSARMFSKPERLLTLDGEWIWIEPSDTRHFSARPTSFHISSVMECKQSTKGGASFKLVVKRSSSVAEPVLAGAAVPATSVGRDTKRYDLEAESADDAEEIVREIHKVMTRRRESGTELAG
ncbi:unnamed protein product [Tilletia laevis]|uniref:Sin1 middle CRIM domain-containing protein n=2 Tax=Tilletia TaxID=13289 RepID=A0A177VHR1_9BASI|nr:hypothetical protein CF336_g2709 [Tilletia laevis]KAE8265027.1 hypothetical protein A4X03_0g529 [Tilletia caries]CAD6909864.1 unnamed protein product [Tilletia controversa]KAE8198088.1 hypothetical protein CF335_g4464 [Tilletia laevis]CAD6890992.1 unnamed protein product [Tilletia caries]